MTSKNRNTFQATAIPPLHEMIASLTGPIVGRSVVEILVNDDGTCVCFIVFNLERTGEHKWEYRGFFPSSVVELRSGFTLPPRKERVRGTLDYAPRDPSWITVPDWAREAIERKGLTIT